MISVAITSISDVCSTACCQSISGGAGQAPSDRPIDPEAVAYLESVGMSEAAIEKLQATYRQRGQEDEVRRQRCASLLKEGDAAVWQSPAATAIAQQLAKLTLDGLEDESASLPEVPLREVGESLQRLGGTSLMSKTLEELVPRTLQRKIEFIWDGIGEWRA